MRRFLYILITLFTALTLGCHRQETLRHAAWKPAGGEFDSLTEKIEWQFNDYVPYDSIARSIERMESIVNTDSTNRKLRLSRTLYWKSKFLGRLENYDSAIKTIKKALQLNDSINHEYDYLRMNSLLCTQSDTIDGGTQYRLFERCIEYARKSGDKAFEAYALTSMGNLLNQIGENDKAIENLYLSNQLYIQSGYSILPIKNKINIARVLSDAGNKNSSDSIMISLIGNPAFERDTFAMNLIPRNLYVSTDSIKYLYQAYAQIKDNLRYRNLRALYEALLANHNYRNGNLDSVSFYADLSIRNLTFAKDYNHKAIIWFNAGLAQSLIGNADSALKCRVNYELYVDSVRMKRQSSEVLRLSALHEMKAMEKDYADATFRRTMVWAFVIVVLIAAGVIVALMLNRRHIRARMLAMEKGLQLEKTRRKVTATTLSIQEKDQLLDVLKNELSDMRRDGGIKEQNARQLESTIKSHLLEHDTEETFQDMFDTVNPDFTRRLRERCPGIADSYVNLACYILMELDNKKIARLMNIKPESVHQSRWRLRQRLHLAEGETLEDALRTLNTPSYLQK